MLGIVTRWLRSLNDKEKNKFTRTGFVKTTGFNSSIIENTYDGASNLTVSDEYDAGLERSAIEVVEDVSGSLNSTYFLLYSAKDVTGYYVWYNVNGAGVDPAIGGKTGIEIALATNASASDVASATVTAIDALPDFESRLSNSYGIQLRIDVRDYEATTPTSDVNTGFIFERLEESYDRVLVATTNITYDGSNNATVIKRTEHV